MKIELRRIMPWAFHTREHSLPVNMATLRIYILPTNRGALFACVILAITVGATNTNNNAGFLFAFVLASMAMVSTLYTQKNLKGLRLISEAHGPVFAKAPLGFNLHLQSEKGLRYLISAHFHGEDAQIMDIPPGDPTSFHITMPTTRRGMVKPRRLILSTTYPLGIFRSWVSIRIQNTCLVFPKPIAYPFVALAAATPGEGGGSDNQPGALDFKELKVYQPGDTVNRIAWKTMARGQGLWTKTFDAETGPSICIAWNLVPTAQRETKISNLCHLVLEAHGRGTPYGLMLPGTLIPPDTGMAHRDRCLTALALID